MISVNFLPVVNTHCHSTFFSQISLVLMISVSFQGLPADNSDTDKIFFFIPHEICELTVCCFFLSMNQLTAMFMLFFVYYLLI